MTFGKKHVTLNGKRPDGPLFLSNETIVTFDVHNLLVLQKGNYHNGKRSGCDRYVIHSQAKEVVSRALKDFKRTVLWSSHLQHLYQLEGSPFDKVDLCIAGGMVVNDNLVKDLKILSSDPGLGNVVALEDEDIYFDPLKRVVPVGLHDNLVEKYIEARNLVFRR